MSENKAKLKVPAADQNFLVEFNPYQDFRLWKQERHCNAAVELHLILEGSCLVSVEEGSYTLAENDVLLIAPGVHHMSDSGEGPFEHISISFSPVTLQGIQTVKKMDRCVILSLEKSRMEPARKLVSETKRTDIFREEMISALLKEIFLMILRDEKLFSGSGKDEYRETSDPFDNSRIRTDLIDEFFEKHHAENVSEETLAGLLGVSTRQLSRILQQNYQMCYRDKLLAARMDHAAWLLRTTSMSVSDISEAVGYSSEGCLFRHFRKYFSLTPKQYRRSLNPDSLLVHAECIDHRIPG